MFKKKSIFKRSEKKVEKLFGMNFEIIFLNIFTQDKASKTRQ